MSAQNLLLTTLRNIRASGRAALCGYFLVGYPTPEAFFHAVRCAYDLDVIEFGIPAEHPALDGPVIASAHTVVTMQRGLGAETSLVLLGGLRDIRQPRFVMTYAEVGRALDGFLRLCVANGVHGILAPDIDPQEGAYVGNMARALNLAVFTLVDARTGDDETIRRCTELSDIIYIKAASGRTGQSIDVVGELRQTLVQLISVIRKIKPAMPIAVGVGVQNPEQVAALAALDVDMVIVGTRIIEHLQIGEQSLVDYIRVLRDATWYPKQ